MMLNRWIESYRARAGQNLRWYIAGLLMLTTLLSYLDRQSFSIASVVIIKQYHFNPEDYAKLVMAFSLAFGLAMPFTGRFVDRVGTRRGLATSMITWSVASMAHALGNGILSFGICRAVLGVTESNNFPSAAKAVSEWFPPKERATATGIYNCGAGLGALIAPPLLAGLLIPRFGWRVAFLLTGSLGFLLVWAWLRIYHPPAQHPRISPAELDYIKQEQAKEAATDSAEAPRGVWREVLGQRNFWGMALARIWSDPVWWFYLAWLPPYLSDVRHYDLAKIAMFAWMPFLTSDFGSIAGGALSSYLVKRGLSTITARKICMCMFAALMPVAIPAALTKDVHLTIFLICIATFAHQGWSANTLTLPTDLFPKRTVACAYGLAAGMSNVASTFFTFYVGWMVMHHGYTPVFVTVAFMHPLAAVMGVIIIRRAKTRASGKDTSNPKDVAPPVR
jgi:ACS family hexuronate transporter-like MFS transporter